MRSKRVLSAVAVAAIAGLVVTACGSGDGGDSGSDGNGELNLSLGEPANLVPPNVGETEGGEIVRMTYSGLYNYANDGTLAEVIAAGQPSTTDNKVWTIKLNTGFKFQNGEEINADLFKKSWDFAAYGPNANGGGYFFSRIDGYADMQSTDPDGEEGPKKAPEPKAKELTGVKVVDPTTIEITLTDPWVGFPTMLGYTAFYPTAEACRTAVDACNEAPIGNGAFKIVGKWEHDSAIKLERWDEYTGAKPEYKNLNYKIYTGQSNCWADFEAGTIDICAPTPDAYLGAKDTYGSKMIEAPSPSTWSLGYPVYDDIFKDVKVRQAFSQAINRQEIIDAIFQGQGKPLDTFTPEMIPGYKAGTAAAYTTFDATAAKALLDSSSWPKGKKVELWINSGSTGETILKAIGDQLSKNLGLEYELKTLEWPQFLQKKTDHELTGPFFTGWAPDYALSQNYMGPLYASIAGNGSDNDFGYFNQSFEDALAAGDQSATLPEAIVQYQAAEAILGEDLPVAPLFTRMTSTVIGDKLDFDSVDRNPILGEIDLIKLKLA